MLAHLQRELKELLGRDRPLDVLRRLKEEVLDSASQSYNNLILLESRYHASQKEGHLGLITIDDKSVKFNTITQALLWFVDQLEITDLNQQLRRLREEHVSIPRQHRYTCDRVDQSELVQLNYYENTEQKIRHFYLYGDARQAMSSLYKRLGYDLAGHLLNWRDQDYQPNQHPAFIECKPANHRLPKLFLINLYKELLAQFRLDTQRNILQRKVSEVCDSPRLRKGDTDEAFGADDFVFVLITLDHFNWNERVTPEVVKSFIENFCACELPPDAPNFFFFYGIEYGKENTEVQKSVQQHVEQATYGEKLPPLKPVTGQDVAEWFSRYDVLLPKGDSPETMTTRHFGEQEHLDMIDVEIKLEELIDRHNKGLLHE